MQSEEQELVNQVMSLTEEEIMKMTEEEQRQVREVRENILRARNN